MKVIHLTIILSFLRLTTGENLVNITDLSADYVRDVFIDNVIGSNEFEDKAIPPLPTKPPTPSKCKLQLLYMAQNRKTKKMFRSEFLNNLFGDLKNKKAPF